MAETTDISCEDARKEMEQTQQTLLLLEQKPHQIQQRVRSMYHELLICQSSMALPVEDQKQCATLQAEGAKQF